MYEDLASLSQRRVIPTETDAPSLIRRGGVTCSYCQVHKPTITHTFPQEPIPSHTFILTLPHTSHTSTHTSHTSTHTPYLPTPLLTLPHIPHFYSFFLTSHTSTHTSTPFSNLPHMYPRSCQAVTCVLVRLYSLRCLCIPTPQTPSLVHPQQNSTKTTTTYTDIHAHQHSLPPTNTRSIPTNA